MTAVVETRPAVVGRGLRRAISWVGTLAVIAVLVGAWQVGIWVNHWYMAERFANGATDATWTIAELLRSGNEALVHGFCWLGVSAALAVVAGALVRRARSRSASR
ncbi:hypothetical protein [Cellulomonas sp. PhB150]|uniref:hypothetical protein n=1 Tax=Cellulomonas sp. PhB150 TaxID=2485188 RepID=UPI000F46F3E6|nr:hypothetical protein [Cellulomonas sp. PhB150]ROS31407.1 hypothetical protein EDF34_1065 [Cellulomonas sp. PhB150]